MARLEVYIVRTDFALRQERECMELLSDQRREKAKNLVSAECRAGSIAAGLLLRKFLGEESYSVNTFGKPETAGGRAFSLAHGGGYAVLAIGQGRVGVDIEPVPQTVPELPDAIFTAGELDWLKKNDGPDDFAYLWTRLESALKAEGVGFEPFDRAYSVIGDEGPWHIHSFIYDGHMISCAADRDFEPEFAEINWQELIK